MHVGLFLRYLLSRVDKATVMCTPDLEGSHRMAVCVGEVWMEPKADMPTK